MAEEAANRFALSVSRELLDDIAVLATTSQIVRVRDIAICESIFPWRLRF